MKDNVNHTQKSEQHAMLDELESIKKLLLENEDSNEFDIPTLDHPAVESVEKILEPLFTNDITEIDADIRGEEYEHSLQSQTSDTTFETSSKLVQQQNLFQEPGSSVKIGDNNIVKARGENPFLPKHIRDRLHGDRSMLSNTVVQSLSGAAKGETDEIIDELIAELLPDIEVKLRKRLKSLIEQPLQQGPPEEPSQ